MSSLEIESYVGILQKDPKDGQIKLLQFDFSAYNLLNQNPESLSKEGIVFLDPDPKGTGVSSNKLEMITGKMVYIALYISRDVKGKERIDHVACAVLTPQKQIPVDLTTMV